MTRQNHSRRRDARDYMARHGVTYTQALRALDGAGLPDERAAREPVSSFRPRPADEGGPSLPTIVAPGREEISYICGHLLVNTCEGCGACTTCDGCYCAEGRAEAELDAYFDQVEREHEKHQDRPGEGCPTCEYDEQRTQGWTVCPKCQAPMTGFRNFRHHDPPWCRPDGSWSVARPDISHLIGRRVTIDNRWLHQGPYAHYAKSYTGTVARRAPGLPTLGIESPFYLLRLDPDDSRKRGVGAEVAFDPREYTITEHETP